MEAKKDAISSSPPAETPSRTLVLQGNNQEGSREDTKQPLPPQPSYSNPYGYNSGYSSPFSYGGGYGGGYGVYGGGYGGMYGGGGYGYGGLGGPGGRYPNGPVSSLMTRSQSLMHAINQPMRALSRVSHMLSQSFQALHMSFSGVINLAMGAQLIKNEITHAAHNIHDASLPPPKTDRPAGTPPPPPQATWGEFLRMWMVTLAVVKILRALLRWLRAASRSTGQARLAQAWRASTISRGVFGTNDSNWGSSSVISLILLVALRRIYHWIRARSATQSPVLVVGGTPEKNDSKLEGFEKGWDRLKTDTRLAEALGSTQVMKALLANVRGQKVGTDGLEDDLRKLIMEKKKELQAISKDGQLVEMLANPDLVPEGNMVRDALTRMDKLLDNHCPLSELKQLMIPNGNSPTPGGYGNSIIQGSGVGLGGYGMGMGMGSMYGGYGGYGSGYGGYGGGYGMGGYGGYY
ncbi:hypothetical protein AAMO2058_001674500 [Amorphochlora amoebiformis]